MYLFFNELSLSEAPSKETARQWLGELTEVLAKASGHGFKDFKAVSGFVNHQVAPHYTIYDWFNDKAVDRERRLLLKTKSTKSPYTEDLLNTGESDKGSLFEFHYKKRKAVGLGAAYLFDTLAVSLDNATDWAKTAIGLAVIEYAEDSDQYDERQEDVTHISTIDHLTQLGKWIRAKKNRDIVNGKLLWLHRKKHFPHLVFCDRVRGHLSDLDSGYPAFHAVKKRLFELEDYCCQWQDGDFDGDDLPSKCTPESETRLNRFKDKFEITCPDGEIRLFSQHLRYTPGAGRIHIYPDNETKQIYIGYIGPKIQ